MPGKYESGTPVHLEGLGKMVSEESRVVAASRSEDQVILCVPGNLVGEPPEGVEGCGANRSAEGATLQKWPIPGRLTCTCPVGRARKSA